MTFLAFSQSLTNEILTVLPSSTVLPLLNLFSFIKVKYALPYSFRPAYHIFKLSKPALPFPINLFHIYNPCPPGQSSIKHSFLYKSCPLTGQQESCVW